MPLGSIYPGVTVPIRAMTTRGTADRDQHLTIGRQIDIMGRNPDRNRFDRTTAKIVENPEGWW